jgi:hypothetical protein
MSKSASVSGKINPRLPNDLSERIYVAEWVLRNSTGDILSGSIARVLESKRIRRQTKQTTRSSACEWNDDDVSDRAKKFERLNKLFALEANRRRLCQLWIDRFHCFRELENAKSLWLQSNTQQEPLKPQE